MADAEHEALRRAVGEELRATIDALCSRDAPSEGLSAALGSLKAARRHLDGPERPSYNAGDEYWSDTSGASWEAYLDSTVFGGGTNPLGVPMAIERGTDDAGRPLATGSVVLGRPYEGGPGMVHGGYLAGLFDHMFGIAMHVGSVHGLTGSLTVRYRAPTPILTPLVLRAWFEPANGRRLLGRAVCTAGETVTAEAEGHFVTVDMIELARTMRSRYSGDVGS